MKLKLLKSKKRCNVSRMILPAGYALDGVTFEFEDLPGARQSGWRRLLDLLHRYSLGAFALLFLLVAASAIQVAATYKASQIALDTTGATTAINVPAKPLKGPNMVVTSSQLPQTLQQITAQPITLTAGTRNLTISPDSIKQWMQVVTDHKAGVSYIHVDQSMIGKGLEQAAAPYLRSPVNQITVSRAGGASEVIAVGRNGIRLGDVSGLTQQISSGLLGAKGMQANLPLEDVAFAVISPANFDKLIEVDVNTKQMWTYEKGQLVRTFAISAGAPATPTPIGQYKIYSKPAVQDMKGNNPDGSKYLQPHVRWINYFLPGGYAIHGNYWRPSNVFGAVNTSHGCVSLPEDQAKWVYDWAPIGTTVITHY